MDTQTSTHMTHTVKQAAAHYNVSDKTIRRWIKQGRVNAEQVEGRWQVHVARDDDLPEVQDNVQNDQDNDPPDENGTGKSEEAGTSMVIDQMQSEITHLRDQLQGRDTQIDHLTQLLAMQTNQNTLLVEQLDPPPLPRTSLYTRFTELIAKLKNGTPNRNSDEHTQK